MPTTKPALSGRLRLIPEKPLLDGLALDYEKMVADGMFEGEPPDFGSIIARLDKLEKEINGR
ncbi:MAG: hypothetical protein AUG07_03155 [Acidobacteria bacterium 13_1_20CM_2_60_10]|nr:MAG: hypothetical protein AUG07_03155 [Acidobacteria bacterium 13_1_20CM_2_60_10]